MAAISENVRCININTGNILSMNDITKKAGQTPSEELAEAIKITLNEWCDNTASGNNDSLSIFRRHDDLLDKMSAQERSDLKVGIKLFITSVSEKAINDAISNVFTALKVDCLDNLILCYTQKSADDAVQTLSDLKVLWTTLESFTKTRKILQLGLSDVEENTFRDLYQWAEVKPSIIQINLATCCVVPPTLQQFCKDNEVQLLTHSDPSEILPNSTIKSIFGDNFVIHWTLRFFVHIKCRGVLATKGYLISMYKH